MRKSWTIAAVLAGSLVFASAVRADIIAYTTASTVAPNQSYGGGFGMDFSPAQSVTVTQLGLYSGLGNGFAATDYATLFTSGGTELGQVRLGPGNPGTQATGTRDFFQTLSTPLTLTAGSTYTIAAFYTNGTDQLANSNGNTGQTPSETGTPYISYVGAGRYGGSDQNGYPPTADGGPADRYNGPTFAFTVPEPAALGLLAAASLMLLARRKIVS